jgi:hypothetical protein
MVRRLRLRDVACVDLLSKKKRQDVSLAVVEERSSGRGEGGGSDMIEDIEQPFEERGRANQSTGGDPGGGGGPGFREEEPTITWIAAESLKTARALLPSGLHSGTQGVGVWPPGRLSDKKSRGGPANAALGRYGIGR